MKAPEKSSSETAINWYPGHMLRAKKELIARLKQVDMVLELRDARIPLASTNEDFEPIFQQKKRIVLLNKSGLADEAITEQWQAHFKEKEMACRFVDVQENQGVQTILPLARSLMQNKWQRFKNKGIRPPALRLMIVGIPNVGKSSLINKLVKRHATQTGPQPGVTRRQEWVKLGKDMELLDTPGILWPKFETPEMGMVLALTGAIKDRIAGEVHQSHYLIRYHMGHYPAVLLAHYQLEIQEAAPEEVLEALAHKRGCLHGGGKADLSRAAKLLLRDFRAGKLGRMSFEKPAEPIGAEAIFSGKTAQTF